MFFKEQVQGLSVWVSIAALLARARVLLGDQ
jgi:hypothetical protein